MERGATHFTHWFQPLTGMTAEKHDSFYAPDGRRQRDRRVLGQGADPGRAGRVVVPDRRHPRDLRGARLHGVGSRRRRPSSSRTRTARYLCIPTAFASWTGEALDHKIPLLRSMDALSSTRAARAASCSATTTSTRVFTTVGPEQEYFLIDERFYFERPDLITTGRTLFGAKPPKGHELDDHYFGSIPERVLACMLETEQQLARLGVPIKTRHNEVAPAQYEVAPVFENSNVGCDHQQLTMQVMQNVARRYGLVCLLHEKPFAGVNGSGKHNNWSMGTDTGHNLLEPGDTPHENLQFLFFCAAVHPGGRQAPGAAARVGRQRRPGPPPGRQRGAAGDHLDLPRRRAGEGLRGDRVRLRRRGDAAELPRAGRLGAADAADARRRPQPDLAVRLHRQQVRVPRARLVDVAGAPEHGAQHDRRRGDRRAGERARAACRAAASRSRRPCSASVKRRLGRATSGSCSTATTTPSDWHAEAEQRGLANLRQTPDALPWLVEPEHGRGVLQVRGAVRARARVALRGVRRAVRRRR